MQILWIALVNTVLQIPPLSIRYKPFSGIISATRKKVLFALYTVALAAYFALWLLLGKYNLITKDFYMASIFTASGALSLINIFVIKGKFREHLFVTGIEFLMGQFLIVVNEYILHFIPFEKELDYILIGPLCILVLYCAAYYIIKKLLVSTVTPFLTLEVGKYWNTICTIPIAIHLSTALSFSHDAPVTSPLQILGQAFVVTAAVLMCRSIAVDSWEMRNKVEMSEIIGRQKAYYDTLSERVLEMRKIKHDLKHHIDTIEYFLDKNDEKGLFEYCKETLGTQDQIPNIIYSGNAIVDALILHYELIASKNNIRFNVKGNFKDIDMKDSDLSVLIGNALDNAVAGCLTTEDNRNITLDIRNNNGALTIMVQNSFNGEIKKHNGEILSSKRKNEPGLGLVSMKSICERYGGEMDVRHEGNVFSVMFYNL